MTYFFFLDFFRDEFLLFQLGVAYGVTFRVQDQLREDVSRDDDDSERHTVPHSVS